MCHHVPVLIPDVYPQTITFASPPSPHSQQQIIQAWFHTPFGIDHGIDEGMLQLRAALQMKEAGRGTNQYSRFQFMRVRISAFLGASDRLIDLSDHFGQLRDSVQNKSQKMVVDCHFEPFWTCFRLFVSKNGAARLFL